MFWKLLLEAAGSLTKGRGVAFTATFFIPDNLFPRTEPAIPGKGAGFLGSTGADGD